MLNSVSQSHHGTWPNRDLATYTEFQSISPIRHMAPYWLQSISPTRDLAVTTLLSLSCWGISWPLHIFYHYYYYCNCCHYKLRFLKHSKFEFCLRMRYSTVRMHCPKMFRIRRIKLKALQYKFPVGWGLERILAFPYVMIVSLYKEGNWPEWAFVNVRVKIRTSQQPNKNWNSCVD